MKRTMLLIVTACTVCAWAGTAWASAYAIPEQSARATGLSAAMTAAVDGPDAIFYNPAALVRIGRPAVTGNLTIVSPSFTLANGATEEDDEIGTFYIPALFTSCNAGTKNLAIGLGVYAPFGLGSDWSETGIARYASYHGAVETIYVSPAVAYQVTPELSLGATVSYITGKAELGQKIPFQFAAAGLIPLSATDPLIPDGDVSFDGDGDAFGWSVGLLYDISPALTFGATYRAGTTLELDGTATYSDLMAVGLTSFDLDGATELPLPGVASIGLAWKATPSLLVSAEVDMTQWSDFEELFLDLEDNFYGSLGADVTRPEDWEDTITFRLGAEYALDANWDLRCGLMIDQSPIPDETLSPFLPDADRTGVSVGFGYTWGKFAVDAGYLALFFADREVSNTSLEGGTQLGSLSPLSGEDSYTGFSHLLSASLSYLF